MKMKPPSKKCLAVALRKYVTRNPTEIMKNELPVELQLTWAAVKGLISLCSRSYHHVGALQGPAEPRNTRAMNAHLSAPSTLGLLADNSNVQGQPSATGA